MSDGQFSSKPMWTGKKSGFTTTATLGTGAFSANDARDFAQSPSVRRELEALSHEPHLDVGRTECHPFPRHIPEHARAMGQPFASATLVQEYLFGLVFLRICGWVFIPGGAIMALIGAWNLLEVVVVGDVGRGWVLIGVARLVGGTIAAIGGLWFGILRGRVVNERCWFCPEGMVWMTNNLFEWYPWEDIAEVYAQLNEHRPAVGLRFEGPISWITFSNTRASHDIVHHVEKRASAAWLPDALKLIAEGKSIPFGDWRLQRLSLDGPKYSILWTQVVDLHVREGELRVSANGPHPETAIWLDDVPLPSLFIAMSRALLAFTRER